MAVVKAAVLATVWLAGVMISVSAGDGVSDLDVGVAQMRQPLRGLLKQVVIVG